MTAVSDYILPCLKILAVVCAIIQATQRKTVKSCHELLILQDGPRRLVLRRVKRE